VKRNSSSLKDTTLLLDVWLVSHLTGRLLDDALRPLGLTGDEFGLYSLIHSAGPVTPTQISRWTGMAQTTVSGMLRRIAARGHLGDFPNPDDARSRLLRLSDDGMSVTGQAAAVLAETLPLLDDALDAGQHAIREKLGDLDEGLRRLVDAAPRPYALADAGQVGDRPTISYRGPHLSRAQTDEVSAFIDWLRTRDRPRPADAAHNPDRLPTRKPHA
jgi:DNA-binding MarR family transcriptional regulator